MAKREIDLNRCLFHYTNVSCHRCEVACPQQAIKNRTVDADRCDDCGLCTAVCPTGAVQSCVDYDSCLSQTTALEPQVLMCAQVSAHGMQCLGALTRQLLWALASRRPLAIDTSRCAACNPAVSQWLDQEIAACNQALEKAGKASIRLVHVREAAPSKPKVARRAFFRSLLSATAQGVADFTAAQTERLYAFDPVIWLEKQQAESCNLFPALTVSGSCNFCGLCTMLCPEKAITITDDPASASGRKIQFAPLRCTACAVCTGNCPHNALTLSAKEIPQERM